MSSFWPAVEYVLKQEGGFVNDPRDSGKATNFGISLRFLKELPFESRKQYGIYDPDITTETIQNLTVEQARLIYKGEFWHHAPFESIIRQEQCNYIFDMAVNMGIAPAVKCVQRACWAVTRKWELLADDGILGDKTISMINLAGMFLFPALRAERGRFYHDLVEKNPEKKEFLNGWYNRTYNTQ